MVSLRSLKRHLLYTATLLSSSSSKAPQQVFPLHLHQHVHVSPPISFLPSVSQTNFSTCADVSVETDSEKKKVKKPLDIFFQEAVGLIERPVEEIEQEDRLSTSTSSNSEEIITNLKKLEMEVTSIKGYLLNKKKDNNNKDMPQSHKQQQQGLAPPPQVPSLSSMFTSKPNKMFQSTNNDFLKDSHAKDNSPHHHPQRGLQTTTHHHQQQQHPSRFIKDLSPEMLLLARRLYDQGYLMTANFLSSKTRFDPFSFSTYYSHLFLIFAAQEFANDHHDIAKSLPGDEVKRVAFFGCPSVEKRTAFSAKRLRSYFSIREDIVCRPCKLKGSCKVMNHTVGKKVYELNMSDVMRVLTLYALELVPPQLSIPDEMQASVGNLLKKVVSLSQQ